MVYNWYMLWYCIHQDYVTIINMQKTLQVPQNHRQGSCLVLDQASNEITTWIVSFEHDSD